MLKRFSIIFLLLALASPVSASGPQLSDVEMAAVITYQRNALGNSTGDMVQPSDIAAVR